MFTIPTRKHAGTYSLRKLHFLFAGEMSGGNISLFQNLQQSISPRSDISSTWLAIEYNPNEYVTRLPVISSNWTLRGGLATKYRIQKLLDKGVRFDAAFFNHHVIATFMGRFCREVPSVMTMDATPIRYNEYSAWYDDVRQNDRTIGWYVKRAVRKSVFSTAVHFLPWSNWTAESLVNDYHMPPEKITVMPPSVNVNRWKYVHRFPKERVRVLFVGGDFVRKGGDLLLAIASLPEFQSCDFHFVTRGRFGSSETNVFFHEGITNNSQALVDLHSSSDVFVLPTRADFSSVASVEAMATGLPVISTFVGGIPDIVEDGRTGYLIQPDDEASLILSLRRLVNNYALRIQLGTNARMRVQELFCAENNSQIIVNLLKRAALEK